MCILVRLIGETRKALQCATAGAVKEIDIPWGLLLLSHVSHGDMIAPCQRQQGGLIWSVTGLFQGRSQWCCSFNCIISTMCKYCFSFIFLKFKRFIAWRTVRYCTFHNENSIFCYTILGFSTTHKVSYQCCVVNMVFVVSHQCNPEKHRIGRDSSYVIIVQPLERGYGWVWRPNSMKGDQILHNMGTCREGKLELCPSIGCSQCAASVGQFCLQF